MAKNTRILTNIAFKKLANATITNPGNSEFQETIKTNIQIGANTIFANTPPVSGLPTTLYDTSSDGYVQYVELDLVAIGSSNYDADTFSGDNSNYDDVDNGQGVIDHAYAAKLPANYETQDGSNSDSTSQNPKAGTGYFVNGGFLSGSGGSVQIVPPSFGLGYIPVIEDSNGSNPSLGGDAQDFYIDYYSGVVFRQDDDPNSYYPVKLKCYIYISDFVTDALQNVGDTVDLHISASEGGGFSFANTATASFESGSAGITVTATPASNTITIGASTDNVTFNQITASIINADKIEASEYIVSSSITYMTQSFSSGSTIFGDTNNDTHQFTGSLYVLHTGSNYGITLTGSGLTINSGDGASISASGFISASDLYLTNTLTALDGGVTVTSNASVELYVDGNITASGNISASSYYSNGYNALSVATVGGATALYVGPDPNIDFNLYGDVSNTNLSHIFTGNITASGNISASGLLFASASDDGGSVGSIAVAMYDTVSGRFYYTASEALGDTTLLEASASAGIRFEDDNGGFSTSLTQTASFAAAGGSGLTVDVDSNVITYTLVGVLSSSQQIATDISGAIDAATGSVLSDYGLLSSSQQIATDISGAIDAATGSLLTDYGLLSGSAQIATDISGAIGAATASLSASIVGTANEVEVVGTLGGNITIGLPDNVIIAGNLTVQGTTTTIDTTNLQVEDSFIHLSSGSGTNGNGGIIIERATDNTGTALFWDETNGVWAVDLAGASAPGNTANADANIVFVSHSSANPTGNPLMGATENYRYGQMYIATTDNDGDGNNIWIYA